MILKKDRCQLADKIKMISLLLGPSLPWMARVKRSINQKISNEGLLKVSRSRSALEIRLRRSLPRHKSTRPTAALIIRTNNSMADYKLITIPRLWRTLGLTKRPSCLFKDKWWACLEVCHSLWTRGVAPPWCRCRCSQACQEASQGWVLCQCKVLRWVETIVWWCIFARNISLSQLWWCREISHFAKSVLLSNSLLSKKANKVALELLLEIIKSQAFRSQLMNIKLKNRRFNAPSSASITSRRSSATCKTTLRSVSKNQKNTWNL